MAAGLPRSTEDQTVYDTSPQEVADFFALSRSWEAFAAARERAWPPSPRLRVRGRKALPQPFALLPHLFLAGMVAYLIGSFPTGVLLSRIWAGVDPRFLGSSHTGGLNVLRVTGKLWLAVLTALVDGAKGIIAVGVGGWLAPTPWALPVAGVMAAVGHCWSLYARFQGGMGLSTLGSILLFVQPVAILVVAGLWFVLYRATRHPARAMLLALSVTGPTLWLLGEPGPVVALGVTGCLALIVRQSSDWHRDYERERQE
jgi:glycerol-3-phosphate acyltransferase PlsY